MDKKNLWKKTLAQIEVKLDSQAQFKTWFKDTRLIDIEGKKAIIGVKNSYTADWLKKKHKSLIQNTLNYVFNSDLKPEFVYDKELAQKTDNKKPKDVDQPILKVKDGVDDFSQKRVKSSNLNGQYSFTNYVVGSSNKLAHAAALSVAENPGRSYNPLFLYGPTGVGKTHLLQAIGKNILDGDPDKKVLYCSSETFLNDMVANIRANTMDKFRNKYRKLDLLLIDDIQLLSNRKETQGAFFNTFNVLFHAKKQIVITSDRTPEEIPNVEDRLISRFQGGMVADISKPDFVERVAILEQKMKDYGFDLPETTIRYIAEIVTDNIRELEGALQKVSLFGNMTENGELSQAEIAKILGKDPQSKRKKVKLSTVFKKVAKEFEVTVKDIKGPRRTKDVAFARQVSMYILRTEFGYKLEKVASLLNRSDHTTAIHAIDKVKSMIESNITFKDQLENLIDEIHKPTAD